MPRLLPIVLTNTVLLSPSASPICLQPKYERQKDGKLSRARVCDFPACFVFAQYLACESPASLPEPPGTLIIILLITKQFLTHEEVTTYSFSLAWC